jgi:hypothetical protein
MTFTVGRTGRWQTRRVFGVARVLMPRAVTSCVETGFAELAETEAASLCPPLSTIVREVPANMALVEFVVLARLPPFA